jgi:CHAT domain-containing protein/tetratricopeptide (TPR) repeat protein
MTLWSGHSRRRLSSFSRALAFVLAVSTTACGGSVSESAAGIEPRRRAIRALLDDGRYVDAESSAAALLDSIRGSAATAAADAFDLLVEARWRNGHTSADTLAEAEHAVRLRAPGPAAARAPSLVNQGRVLFAAGRPQEAADALQSALIALESQAPATSRDLADALDAFAAVLMELARYEAADQALAHSLTLREREPNRDAAALAGTLQLVARSFVRQGQYANARAPLDRALLNRRDRPEHPDNAVAHALLGDLLWFEGRPAAAHEAYSQCTAIARHRLRPDHPELALCTRRAGLMLVKTGDIDDARRLLEQAARMAERGLGNRHPLFAGYLNDLAEVHLAQLDFRAARSLYEQALAILEPHTATDRQDVGTLLYNLALVSSELGDLTEARRYYDRAIPVWRTRYGAEHPFVALATASLAQTLMKHRRASEALALQRQVLAIRQKALGPNHVDTADTRGDLAVTLLSLGRNTEAARESERAIIIWERTGVRDSPAFAAALKLRADILAATGNAGAARARYTSALSITERVFGPEHPTSADLRLRLAALAMLTGEHDAAFRQALAAEEAARDFLLLAVRHLSEREALSYAEQRPSGLNLALSLAVMRGPGGATVTEAVFDAVVKSRALVFDEIASRHRVANAVPQGNMTARWNAWLAARQRYANLAVRSGRVTPSDSELRLLQEARRDAERAERALADENADVSSGRMIDVSSRSLRNLLPPRSVLVSFVKYMRAGAARTGVSGAGRDVPSYLAFIVGSTFPKPVVVSLGSAAGLESAINAWRHETTRFDRRSAPAAEQRLRRTGAALRARVWDPLVPYLGDVDRAFVVPDGALHLINLGALPIGSFEYLVERGPLIQYLNSERDLMHAAQTVSAATAGLLALGGAAFDAEPRPAAPSSASGSHAPVRASCGTFQTMQFTALPETLGEVEDLAGRWRETTRAWGSVELLVGPAADERAFKSKAPGRRVLHLATHGFFLGGECEFQPPASRAVGGLTGGKDAPRVASLESPLLQTGLALAGANRRMTDSQDEEDGILTAEEVASLDLRGVEWVVLSACDTGLGEIRAGEGVFGLRRAFQIAGARTVIMSLWSVEDQATRVWMHALYEGRLVRNLTTADAVRDASLSVLNARRAAKQSTHPFYWAAFVAAGDWR